MNRRIVDPDAILFVRRQRDGVCLWGLRAQDGCSSGLDVHHIDTKGAGGDDVPENLITLCRKHHQQAQERKVSAGDLRKLLSDFFGYVYE
jgi:hypothetical protein